MLLKNKSNRRKELKKTDFMLLKTVFVLVVFTILFPWHTAQAYVDPGTGSYIIQIIVGIFFGTVYATKGLWKGLLQKIRKRRNKENNTNDK